MSTLRWEEFAARHSCRFESEPSIQKSMEAYRACGARISSTSIRREVDQSADFVGVSIRNQQVVAFGPHLASWNRVGTRVRSILSDLQAMAAMVELPNVQFPMHLHDGASFSASTCKPVFVQEKSRTSTGGIYLPPRSAGGFVQRTPERGGELRSEEALMRVAWMDNNTPFNSKANKAFFRGSTTGGVYTKESWRSMHRSRVVQVSLDRPDLLDARFSGFSQCDKIAEGEMRGAGFAGGRVDQDAQWKFKLIVVPDGNSVPDRLLSQLASNSVVLKPESDNAEYWYAELVPWEHYIPYKSNASNLAQVIESALKNQALLEHIATKSTQFVLARLNPSRVMCYWGLLLRAYAAHFNTA
ncbi:glycosyl transferase family 90-domain-containing protein [Baffinella frigidus]|nr:glycosyl transferase family 90-domain-containing protein [Cryptophyta sp. CCMP2293]